MDPLVPPEFEVPTTLVTVRFRLEPLGPQHNDADHAAWTSSIEHISQTPGFDDRDWPPPAGMSLAENRADLQRHAEDFVRRRGFTYTVLDIETDDVIGCVYIYPSDRADHDADVRSWVCADRAELDGQLASTVASWLDGDWPVRRISPGRTV
ncbi:MAG: N-acetyltransferase [Ilumatobacteraceae bacterium]